MPIHIENLSYIPQNLTKEITNQLMGKQAQRFSGQLFPKWKQLSLKPSSQVGSLVSPYFNRYTLKKSTTLSKMET